MTKRKYEPRVFDGKIIGSETAAAARPCVSAAPQKPTAWDAMCQWATLHLSLDYLVGAREQWNGGIKAQRPSSLQIDRLLQKTALWCHHYRQQL